jgi:hypothetical protein
MNIFKQIGNFFLCFLKDDCIYSIKKLLVYIFTAIVIYQTLFTDKDIYQLLTFILVLLGIRTFEKLKMQKVNNSDDQSLGKKKILND